MPEWIFDAGIGERRAALIDGGQIIEARLERDGDGLRAGTVIDARLTDRRHRLAETDAGQHVYLSRLPAVTEGARFRALVQRPALPERDLTKRAKAVPVDPATPLAEGDDLHTQIAESGWPVRTQTHGVGSEPDLLQQAGWDELVDEAATGIIAFAEGLLRVSLTPAMTVADVDGATDGETLALRAVTALAGAIRRHGIGGNIVIDLPTLPHAAARKTVAQRFDEAMADSGLRCERTAINGFGLLQIILPRRDASLLERFQFAPVQSAALTLLRRASRAQGTGDLCLTAHPAVIDWLAARTELLADLSRRSGRAVVLQRDAARGMDAGHAQ